MALPDITKRYDLADLRKEADAQKQCFTQFSFQILIVSSAFLGLILRFGANAPEIKLSSALVALVIVATARIGAHKYATANRISGFQLFIERLTNVSEAERPKLTDATIDVGWEEAMRAWRIVQASTFHALYEGDAHFGRVWLQWRNSPKDRNDKAEEKHVAWWNVRSLIASNVKAE